MTRLTCSLIMATVSLFLWTHLQAAPPEEEEEEGRWHVGAGE